MNLLDKLVMVMQTDGGEWREVRFHTKSSTTDIFKALKKLDGLADVYIYSLIIDKKKGKR